MSYYPDMGQEAMVAVGPHIRAVGWLHHEHPFTTGKVSGDVLNRLKQFAANSGTSSDELWFGAFCGVHHCEFCNNAIGVGNFGVPHDDHLFVVPEMIVHYIEQHEYKPPDEFIAAVMRCPLPGSEEYSVLTEPFWHLHKQAHEAETERAFINAGKWAADQDAAIEAIRDAALRFFGNNSQEMCERIRKTMVG